MDQVLFLKLFAALFAIMNPIANLPVFLSLTADKGPGFERKVALTVLVGLALGSAFIGLTGDAILKVFGISLDAFRLAGGFLILLIALNLISGEKSKAHHGTDEEQEKGEELPLQKPLPPAEGPAADTSEFLPTYTPIVLAEPDLLHGVSCTAMLGNFRSHVGKHKEISYCNTGSSPQGR